MPAEHTIRWGAAYANKPIDFTKYYNLIQGYPRLKIRGGYPGYCCNGDKRPEPFVGEVCLVDEARRVPAEVVGFAGKGLINVPGKFEGIDQVAFGANRKTFTIRVVLVVEAHI